MNGPSALLYKEIQTKLDKRRKITKVKMQRDAQMNKIEQLKTKIEEKNNKIHFLPLKKLIMAIFNIIKKIILNYYRIKKTKFQNLKTLYMI